MSCDETKEPTKLPPITNEEIVVEKTNRADQANDAKQKRILEQKELVRRAIFGRRREMIPKRIPRNKPCPCGSGVKYKKCHGRPVREVNIKQENKEAAGPPAGENSLT